MRILNYLAKLVVPGLIITVHVCLAGNYAYAGSSDNNQEKVFVIHAPMSNLEDFRKLARQVSRLKPYGRVQVNISSLADNISRISGITTSLDEAGREMRRRPGESDREFAIRANDLVNSSMIHYWRTEGQDKYYMRIPIWENYIIYFKTLFKDDKRYEFVKYWKKNLERGVGLCSTHSIVLNGILKDNGIESEFWDINRHVILRIKVSDNEWYIMDPDYGLYIPHDRHEILENPELVRPTYTNMASLYKPDYETEYNTDFLVEVYGANEYRIYSYNQRTETIAYRAKWLYPLLLVLPFLAFMLLKIFRNR